MLPMDHIDLMGLIDQADKKTKLFIMQVSFDRNVFTLDCLKKSAYRFIDKFSIDFDMSGDQINCKLNFDSKLTQKQCEFYVDQFKKEILDQDLRESIKRETEPVRNLVLAQAFSKTNLIKDE